MIGKTNGFWSLKQLKLLINIVIGPNRWLIVSINKNMFHIFEHWCCFVLSLSDEFFCCSSISMCTCWKILWRFLIILFWGHIWQEKYQEEEIFLCENDLSDNNNENPRALSSFSFHNYDNSTCSLTDRRSSKKFQSVKTNDVLRIVFFQRFQKNIHRSSFSWFSFSFFFLTTKKKQRTIISEPSMHNNRW